MFVIYVIISVRCVCMWLLHFVPYLTYSTFLVYNIIIIIMVIFKRPSEDGGMAGGVSKRRRLRVGGQQAPKVALMHLYEKNPGLVFEMESQTGPDHAPVFTMSVMVDGEKYSGTGANKRVAKQIAAESALRGSIIQLRNTSQAQQAMGGSQLTSENGGLVRTGRPAASNGSALHRSAPDCEVGVPDVDSKYPVMALQELRPGTKYEQLSETEKVFTMSVVVDEEIFEGCGRSKKMAKHYAAKTALTNVFGVQFPAPTGGFPYVGVHLFNTVDDYCIFWDWMCFAFRCQLQFAAGC